MRYSVSRIGSGSGGAPMLTAQNSVCVFFMRSPIVGVGRRRLGVPRAVGPREPAVHDLLAEAEGEVHDAVLGPRVARRVVVVGAGHSRDRRVEPLVRPRARRPPGLMTAIFSDSMILSDGADVASGRGEERRRVDELHRLDQTAGSACRCRPGCSGSSSSRRRRRTGATARPREDWTSERRAVSARRR